MKFIRKIYFLVPTIIYLLLYSQSVFFGASWGDDVYITVPMAKNFNLMLQGFYRNLPGLHFVPFCYLQSYIIHSFLGNKAFPFGFHLYALIMHSISCVIAMLVMHKLTNSRLISVLIVSLWTVHPTNVENLTRLGCAPAQLASGTFCLTFVWCFLKARETKSHILRLFISLFGILFFFVSITSHEQYLLFPLVLLLILFFLDGKQKFFQRDYLRSFVLPIMLIYPIYLTWKFFACGSSFFYTDNVLITWTEIGTVKDVLFRAYWLAPQLLVHYFRLFFYPDYLAESKADWYMVGSTLWSPYALFCQGLIIMLILSAIYLYKKIPLYTIGILWFFMSLILVLQIIPLFDIVDEHWCYLSTLGFLLSIFCLFTYRWKTISPRTLLLITVSIFCLLARRTLLYLPLQKDGLVRGISMAKYSPAWTKVIYMLEVIQLARKEKRQEELPNWINLDNLQKEVNEWLKNYLFTKPNFSHKFGPMQTVYKYNTYRFISRCLIISNKQNELYYLMKQAIEVKNDTFAWIENAELFKENKDWGYAWQSLKHAIRSNPLFMLIYNKSFIEIAVYANKIDEAEKSIQNYIKLNPKTSYPYLFAGFFYQEIGETDLALDYFKKALSDDKIVSVNAPWIYHYAASLFLKNKMYDEALQSLNKIISFDPFNKNAKNKLRELDFVKPK